MQMKNADIDVNYQGRSLSEIKEPQRYECASIADIILTNKAESLLKKGRSALGQEDHFMSGYLGAENLDEPHGFVAGSSEYLLKSIQIAYFKNNHQTVFNLTKQLLGQAQEIEQDIAAICLYYNGLTYSQRGMMLDAKQLFVQALQTMTPNNLLEGYAELALGSLFFNHQDVHYARTFYLKAYKVALKKRDAQLLCYVYHNVAEGFYYHSQFDLALQSSLRAMSFINRESNPYFAIEGLSVQSDIYLALGKSEKSIALLREASKIDRQYGHTSGRLRIITSLGKYYLETQLPLKAENALWQALSICKKRDLYVYELTIRQQLAAFYKQRGDSDRALEQMECLHDIQRHIGHTLSRDVLSNKLSSVQIQADLEAVVKVNRELHAQIDGLKSLAFIDDLTRLHNRRYLFGYMQKRKTYMKRQDYNYTLAMFDIDNFKAINDTFSHAIGDAVLQQFAWLLNNYTRQSDIVVRFGGEEFVAVFLNTSLDIAHSICEKLRTKIAAYDWVTIHPELTEVTASIGLAQGICSSDLPDVLDRADKKLYEAKQGGKNRSVV